MTPSTPYQFLFIIILMLAIPPAVTEFYESIARVSDIGWSLLVPVKREILQRRLDQFKGPALFLPNVPVFVDQPTGTHPLLVTIGNQTFDDFVESERGHPESTISTTGAEVSVSIPYLSRSPDLKDNMQLGLAVLYDARRGVVPQADLINRYFPVSEITLSASSLYVRYHDDEIRIEFATFDLCPADAGGSLSYSFSYSYEDTPLERATFSVYGQPTFDFCLFYPFDNDFCSAVAEIEEEVLDAGANVCVLWETDDEVSCDSTGEIVMVSGVFRLLIPIDEPTGALPTYQYSGSYRIGIGAPCV